MRDSSSDSEEDDANARQTRFDFCLQERTVESMIKPVGLLYSHTRYFMTKDVSFFVLNKIHNVPVNEEIKL